MGVCAGFGARTSDARNENADRLAVSTGFGLTFAIGWENPHAWNALTGANAIPKPVQPNAGYANE
jgi:hypothetical protein